MLQVSVNELYSNSLIGKCIVIETDTGKSVSGTLYGILQDRIVIIDDITLSKVELERQHITRAAFASLGSKISIDKQSAIRFKNLHSHMADTTDLTIVGCFTDRIEKYLQQCRDEAVTICLKAELTRHSTSLPYRLIEQAHNHIESLTAEKDNRLVQLILLYRLRRFAECAGVLHDILNDASEERAELICACFFAQCKNNIGSYFWLTRHMLKVDSFSSTESELWWCFLKSSVTYASYEYIEEMIHKIGEVKHSMVVESAAYLHALNNNTTRAIRLIEQLEDITGVDNNYDINDLGLWMLMSDTDNNYHRYMRCIAQIIGNGEINRFDNTNEVVGYVYDYIPDKGYGFILGADLLPYFFNREEIASNSVLVDIKNNICAFLTVDEETLVKVSFTRVEQSKRTYSAYNIY